MQYRQKEVDAIKASEKDFKITKKLLSMRGEKYQWEDVVDECARIDKAYNDLKWQLQCIKENERKRYESASKAFGVLPPSQRG